jgi:hypothetical protein
VAVPVQPVHRHRAYLLRGHGHRLEPSAAQRQPGHDPGGHRRGWKQISYNFLFFLAGLQAIPKIADRGGGDRRRGPVRRFWTIVFPLLSPTAFFLLVVNIIYAFFDTFGIIDASPPGGPAKATQILVYKVYHDGFLGLNLGGSAAQSVILMVDRHRAHRDPVPLSSSARCTTDGRAWLTPNGPFLTLPVAHWC